MIRKLLSGCAAAAVVLVFAVARGAPPRPRPVVPHDQDEIRARAFSASRTRDRRNRLLAGEPDGTVFIIYSGKDPDEDARARRADRDFLYLSGVSDAECWMVLEKGRQALYVQPLNPERDVWTGDHVPPGEATAQKYGFDTAESNESMKDVLAAALGQAQKVCLGNIDRGEIEKIVGAAAKFPGSVGEAASGIGRLRQVKDADELALLQRACQLSCAGFHQAAKIIAPGHHEFEAEALFEETCRFYGAETQGYPSIVGSGPNSCTLHYDADRRLMKDGDMLVLDAGAECGGYSSDVTRTFPVSGHFTDEQRHVYDVVLKAQDAGIAACVPGNTVRKVHNVARAVLQDAGLEQYLPHGVSHWLGLDVHDAGDYSLPLAPGMVLTVEPGCYIAEKQLGVRIEDDVLVTESGPVVLSGMAPRTAEAIEALMATAADESLDPPELPEVPALPSGTGKKFR